MIIECREGQRSTLNVTLITRLTITHITTKSHQLLIRSFSPFLRGQTDRQTDRHIQRKGKQNTGHNSLTSRAGKMWSWCDDRMIIIFYDNGRVNCFIFSEFINVDKDFHCVHRCCVQVIRAALVFAVSGRGQCPRAGHVRSSAHLPRRLLRLRCLRTSSHHWTTLRHAPQRHLLPGLTRVASRAVLNAPIKQNILHFLLRLILQHHALGWFYPVMPLWWKSLSCILRLYRALNF